MLFLGDSGILLLLQDSQLLGFRNSGMEKGFWEGGCSGRMERNANPPLYISQSQASRKHITALQKTYHRFPENTSNPPENVFQSLQKESYIHPESISQSLQKASFKSFQQSYSKSPENKLQASRNPFNPNRQES